ncbi:UNVERIFIED_CONTAM: hypothetical protein Sradi_0248300 [Sesamum radiatum]|uniref:Uncharacterized protein n=1 Tax=Sesamum radiatum TaxID=300843 RepID=A0AAW2W2D9_SESRA
MNTELTKPFTLEEVTQASKQLHPLKSPGVDEVFRGLLRKAEREGHLQGVKAPMLELKELPKHLKYTFLGENDTLPIIISTKLSTLEEEKLIRVIREFREAIGWIIADIKGLSPSTCMHRILLEE